MILSVVTVLELRLLVISGRLKTMRGFPNRQR
jgi:hypothetical protein